jgi:ABC-type nitrate/sulfonate/bicarbonate transport system substrate-binding protein
MRASPLVGRSIDATIVNSQLEYRAEHIQQGGTMIHGKLFAFLSLMLVAVGIAPETAFSQEKIRIGVPLFPTVAFPAMIAQEKGFFEKYGLKAEIIRINSEPMTYQALISGDIDVTSGAPTGLVQSNLQGVLVVSLGSWDNLVSYTITTKEKIDDLSQLRGKKIGINRLGGKSSLILRVMLEAAGLNTTKDVTLLQLGGSQERLAALMRGGIDAPMVVKASSVQANRGKWVRFVRAYLEATHYIVLNREASLELLRRGLGLEEKETLEHTYEQMRARADLDLIAPDAAVDNLIKMMTYVDKRAASVDRSKLADYSIVRELIQNKAVPVKK